MVVKNQGSATAGATTTMVRLNNNPSLSSTSDPQVALSTPSIAPGGTATVQATFTIANAGTYYAHAYVDNYDVLTQSDTSNDKANSSAITVTAPASYPDLIPQSISLSSGSLTAGGTETVTVVVKNQGSATAGATTTMVRLNNNPSLSSTSDPQVALSTPSIAPGGTATVQATFTIANAGTYYAHAYVDNYDVLTQSDTSNDKANSSAITVTGAGGGELTSLGLDVSHFYTSYFTGSQINALQNSLENTYGQFSFVINYLGSTASGYLTKSMADNYISSGLSICTVYEVTMRYEDGSWIDYNPALGNDRYITNCLGYNYGVLDGENAYLNALNTVQQPAGSAIYFAIDGDVYNNNISYVLDYFRGINDGFAQASGGTPAYDVGAYGSGYVLDQVYSAGYANYKWLAAAASWNGSTGYTNYDLKQLAQAADNGQLYDPDIAADSTFGQWGATSAPTTVPEISVSWGGANIPDGESTPSNGDGTDFGSAAQAGSPVQRAFVVFNSGDATLTLGTPSLPTGFSLVEGLSSSIAPGEYDTFTVQLDTTTAGTKGGQISFSNNDSNENPFNFSITGTVNAAPTGPEISVAWGSANIPDGESTPSNGDGTDFGSAAQAGSPVQRAFVVFNSGDATLTLGTPSLPTGFSLVEGLSSSIAPGEYDTFTVQLDTTTAGTKGGQISFSNNDSNENPFNFSITGTVNAAVTQPDLTVTNLRVADTTPTPGQSDTISFNVNNIGADDTTNFEVGLYVSTDPTVDLSDELFAYLPIASQAANSSTPHIGTASLPGDLTPGQTFYIGLIVDDTSQISEANENNNISNVVQITIAAPHVASDFNGDNRSDILWRNNVNGAVIESDMNDRTVLSSGSVGGNLNWSVVGVGDFNGDNRSDILWRNNVNGAVIELDMNDRTVLSSGSVGGNLNWSVVGVGDFNNDGNSDIIWRNNVNGSVIESDMNDRTVLSSGSVGGNLNWSVVGVGDFNNDGNSDILWRNNVNGSVIELDMNDRTVLSSGSVGGNLNWSVVGVGDFNGDGNSDILWRSNVNGAVVESDMNDRTVLSSGGIGGNLNWSVVQVGDYNGDGNSDILWRNNVNGAVVELDMNDRTVLSSGGVGGSLSWLAMSV